MLEPLLGSKTAENVLVYILSRESGYASEIARFFGVGVYGIQCQLEKFELGGVLTSWTAGKTRIFEFNPRYAFKDALEALLRKAIDFYPEDEKDRLLITRRRPRRKGKPL